MIKFLLLIFPLVASAQVSDQWRNNFCDVDQTKYVDEVFTNLEPEYFIRPFPISNKVAFGANGHNQFLDLDNGVVTQAPGSFDAMPMPDEKFWIYPDGKSLHFATFPNGSEEVSELYSDPKMTGYYQSAGKLPADNGRDVYRVMIEGADFGNYYARDYELTADKKIEPLAEPIILCSNLEHQFSLPMLSKSGGKIAFLNNKTMTTQIYSIDTKTGFCKLAKDLGIKTGKVDFSYDDKSIAYHTVSVIAAAVTEDFAKSGWIIKPSEQMVSNAWVMDLQTNKVKQLTRFTNSSAMYPVFNRNGEVLLRKYQEKGASIVKINPAVEKRALKIAALADHCKQGDNSFQAAAALGTLLADLCLQGSELDLSSRSLLVAGLNNKQCKALAKKWTTAWGKKSDLVKKGLPEDALAKLTVKDLEAVCPDGDTTGEKQKLAVPARDVAKVNLDVVPEQLTRCIACHGDDSEYPISFTDRDKLVTELHTPSKTFGGRTLLDEMVNRIQAGSVPPPNEKGVKALNDLDRPIALTWIEAFRKKP